MVGRAIGAPPIVRERLSVADLERYRAAAQRVFVDREVIGYAVALADATRHPGRYGLHDLAPLIEFGASPRGPIGLVQAAQALALLRGRSHAVAEDVADLAADVLRHRLVLTYDALGDGVARRRRARAHPRRRRRRPRPARRRRRWRRERRAALVAPAGAQGPGALRGALVEALDLLLARRASRRPAGRPARGRPRRRDRARADPARTRSATTCAGSTRRRARAPACRTCAITCPSGRSRRGSLLDVSASMAFGTGARLKSDVAAGVVEVVGRLAVRRAGRVALLTCGAPVEALLPPRGGRRALVALRRAVAAGVAPDGDAAAPTTRSRSALRRVDAARPRPGPRRGRLGLPRGRGRRLSGAGVDARAARARAARHDVLAVEVTDPREAELPDAGQLVARRPGDGRADGGRQHDAASCGARSRAPSSRAATRSRAALRRARARHVTLDAAADDWLRDAREGAAMSFQAPLFLLGLARRPARARRAGGWRGGGRRATSSASRRCRRSRPSLPRAPRWRRIVPTALLCLALAGLDARARPAGDHGRRAGRAGLGRCSSPTRPARWRRPTSRRRGSPPRKTAARPLPRPRAGRAAGRARRVLATRRTPCCGRPTTATPVRRGGRPAHRRAAAPRRATRSTARCARSARAADDAPAGRDRAALRRRDAGRPRSGRRRRRGAGRRRAGLHGRARHRRRRGRVRRPGAAGPARSGGAGARSPTLSGGATFAAEDGDALDEVYERLGSQIGTREEKREISAGLRRRGPAPARRVAADVAAVARAAAVAVRLGRGGARRERSRRPVRFARVCSGPRERRALTGSTDGGEERAVLCNGTDPTSTRARRTWGALTAHSDVKAPTSKPLQSAANSHAHDDRRASRKCSQFARPSITRTQRHRRATNANAAPDARAPQAHASTPSVANVSHRETFTSIGA